MSAKQQQPYLSMPKSTDKQNFAVPDTKSVKQTAEQKAEKFKILAIKRGEKAIKFIELLGNLSGKNYVYTEEQVSSLFLALDNSLAQTKELFVVGKKVAKTRINL